MVKNKRSIISINNLIDFIKLTLNHKNASNQIFLVSDSVPISTRDLINKLIQSQNSLFKNLLIPKSILMFTLTILNKKNLANKVLGSLEIDWTKSFTLLGWKPPFNTSDELEKLLPDNMINRAISLFLIIFLLPIFLFIFYFNSLF